MIKNNILGVAAVLLPVSAVASTTLQGDFIQDSKKLSLDNHYTVYENDKKDFIFSELNIQRLYTDDIYIGNLGLGYRTLMTEGNAIGFNAFFDQGLSGNSPNGYGIGFEYLLNGFYLNTNFYFKGRENWQKSGDYKFNDAFDINAQYYIPQTPLSLKASYMRSQKEANLIYGKSERAKGMYSIGLEITPVSLLSVGYAYNRMHSGSNQDENQVYAKFNIRFDKSFAEQIAWNTNENDFADFVKNRKVDRNVMVTVASEKDFPVYNEPEVIPDERPVVPDEKPNNKPEWELKDFGVDKIKHDIDVNGKANYTLKDLAIADKGRKDYLQYLKNLNDKGGDGAPTLADIAKYVALNNM
ncbi:inverse autotransporter beta domain-containing protein [Serratia ureilytica]|uniref:inverse autotransporter beta domain-containing protein n=1 Tax=Serratia ureilytica TaxID=300181 RepID=UPI00313D313E